MVGGVCNTAGLSHCQNASPNKQAFLCVCLTSVYHCGSDEGWSDVFSFTALNDSLSFSPRFALYGDLGNENPQSLARLQKEAQIGMYDAILHIGELHRDELVLLIAFTVTFTHS